MVGFGFRTRPAPTAEDMSEMCSEMLIIMQFVKVFPVINFFEMQWNLEFPWTNINAKVVQNDNPWKFQYSGKYQL